VRRARWLPWAIVAAAAASVGLFAWQAREKRAKALAVAPMIEYITPRFRSDRFAVAMRGGRVLVVGRAAHPTRISAVEIVTERGGVLRSAPMRIMASDRRPAGAPVGWRAVAFYGAADVDLDGPILAYVAHEGGRAQHATMPPPRPPPAEPEDDDTPEDREATD